MLLVLTLLLVRLHALNAQLAHTAPELAQVQAFNWRVLQDTILQLAHQQKANAQFVLQEVGAQQELMELAQSNCFALQAPIPLLEPPFARDACLGATVLAQELLQVKRSAAQKAISRLAPPMKKVIAQYALLGLIAPSTLQELQQNSDIAHRGITQRQVPLSALYVLVEPTAQVVTTR